MKSDIDKFLPEKKKKRSTYQVNIKPEVVDIIREDAKKLKLTRGELVEAAIQSFHSQIKARNK